MSKDYSSPLLPIRSPARSRALTNKVQDFTWHGHHEEPRRLDGGKLTPVESTRGIWQHLHRRSDFRPKRHELDGNEGDGGKRAGARAEPTERPGAQARVGRRCTGFERRVITAILNIHDATCEVVAANGEEAVAKFETSAPGTFDDLRGREMPMMNGRDAACHPRDGSSRRRHHPHHRHDGQRLRRGRAPGPRLRHERPCRQPTDVHALERVVAELSR